ncbi:DASH complex subunit Dam1-domain-containing protein [Xylariomycetidae sp. FL2044]|nr:DASH complex subunit Dam1-domain-containing protein [Xylariomycetidae sp. FL2044]
MSASEGHDSAKRHRSNSRSRPTTPLRPSSRSSFRESAQRSVEGHEPFPLNTFEPAFSELSDAVADLEANMMHFQLMHESLARFSESFASFLYGLNMNAFCVDFPEGPIPESFRRAKQNEGEQIQQQAAAPVSTGRSRSTERGGEMDGETTFMTTDTSFVENPPTSTKPTPKKSAVPDTRQSRVPGPSRGGSQTRGRGGTGRARPSGLVQPKVRGLR